MIGGAGAEQRASCWAVRCTRHRTKADQLDPYATRCSTGQSRYSLDT